jgi:hypothetical protein
MWRRMARGIGLRRGLVRRPIAALVPVALPLAAALAGASPATATLWSPPGNISAEGQSAHAPEVAVDPAGNATAVWTRSHGMNDVVQAAAEPAGGALWGEPATLSEPDADASEAQVAMDSAGDAIAVWTRGDGNNAVVQAAIRPVGKPWGVPVTVSEPGEGSSQPHLAMNAAGDAVLVWQRSNGNNVVVQAASKRADGRWGALATVSDAGEDAEGPRVALDGAGDAVAVWVRSDGSNVLVQSAVQPAGEAPWGKPVEVSEAGRDASEPEIAVDAAGDATAVWTRYDGLKENGGSMHSAQTAAKPAGKPWETPTPLSEEAGEEGLNPTVVMDSAGEATAVWMRFVYGCCRRIETSSRTVGKPWTAPKELEDGTDPRVTVNAAGDAAAVWTRYFGPGDLVQAAVKPAGEPWNNPTTVSEDESSDPAAAVDAASHVTAVWTRYIGFGFGNLIVQASQYAPSKSFTIETSQKLSFEPTYTQADLNGHVGDTVDYEIVVTNTGSTSLRFGALKDASCEGISPAGPTELESLGEETFTCSHKLGAFVKYKGEASIEGDEGTGLQTSNAVAVALGPVFEVPAGAVDSNDGTCVETTTAVYTCANLRAALARAGAAPDSTVKLERGPYQLGEAHGYPPGQHAFLEVLAGVTIEGAGSGETTIEQTDGRDPVIVIAYDPGFSKIAIEGVTITGGVAEGEDGGEFFGWEKGGGGLRILASGSPASSVTLTNDELTGNLAHAQNAKGGAIFNKRTLNIIGSTIDHNKALATGAGSGTELGEADGGGIFNVGHLLISGSTIAANTVEAGGVNSRAEGGGVNSGVENFTSDATAAIVNSTIVGNIASAGKTKNPPLVYGGGIAIDNGVLDHVTLYGNTASPIKAWEAWGGNVYEPQNGGGASISNSIVAAGGATKGPNCMFQSFTPYPEYNRDDLLDGPEGECNFKAEFGALLEADAQLRPLADNGGPSQTLALETGSPAISGAADCIGNFGESGSGWSTASVPLDIDQRGMPRDGHCDIGAFQAVRPVPTTPPAIGGAAEPGETLNCTPGAWAGDGNLVYAYSWLRNGSPTGDTTTSYAVSQADVGSLISCVVMVSGTYGNTEAASAPVEPLPPAPSAFAGAASLLTATTATLNATVNPNGGPVTKCEFRYGRTESYTLSVPCAVSPGAGSSPVSVTASITALSPDTGYHFRIVASGAGGSSEGADGTFTTAQAAGGPSPEENTRPPEEQKPPATETGPGPGETGVLGSKESSPTATLTNALVTAGLSGAIKIGVSCPAETTSCTGTVTLKTFAPASRARGHSSRKRRAAVQTLAVGSFKVAGGHTALITLRLSRSGRGLLGRGSLRVRAIIVASNPAGARSTSSRVLTIRARPASRG